MTEKMTHNLEKFALFLVSVATYFELNRTQDPLTLFSKILDKFRICLDKRMKSTRPLLKVISNVWEIIDPIVALRKVNEENKPKFRDFNEFGEE